MAEAVAKPLALGSLKVANAAGRELFIIAAFFSQDVPSKTKASNSAVAARQRATEQYAMNGVMVPRSAYQRSLFRYS